MKTVEVPDELLELLTRSRLHGRTEDQQVQVALAIILFQEGVVSTGRAAALSGLPRVEFESRARCTGARLRRSC